tara:strand:+ start:408 stop:560 length:153 start_codon:yes stop_codon:yes gene_type:complete
MGWVNNHCVKIYEDGGDITSGMSKADTPINLRRGYDWDKKKKKENNGLGK